MVIFAHWELILLVLGGWCLLSIMLIPLAGFVARRIR